jgi:hypothetical protein
MLLHERAQERSFMAANEFALTADSHHAARTFNGYVQTVPSSRGQRMKKN